MKKIVPFTMEHGRALDITMSYSKLYEYAQGPSYTFIVDEKVVCAAGVIIMWKGVGLAWSILGPDFVKHRFITRTVRRTLRDIMRAFSLDRIEAQTLSREDHENWLRVLGFVRECGVARKYVDGQDVVRFEYIRSDNA